MNRHILFQIFFCISIVGLVGYTAVAVYTIVPQYMNYVLSSIGLWIVVLTLWTRSIDIWSLTELVDGVPTTSRWYFWYSVFFVISEIFLIGQAIVGFSLTPPSTSSLLGVMLVITPIAQVVVAGLGALGAVYIVLKNTHRNPISIPLLEAAVERLKTRQYVFRVLLVLATSVVYLNFADNVIGILYASSHDEAYAYLISSTAVELVAYIPCLEGIARRVDRREWRTLIPSLYLCWLASLGLGLWGFTSQGLATSDGRQEVFKYLQATIVVAGLLAGNGGIVYLAMQGSDPDLSKKKLCFVVLMMSVFAYFLCAMYSLIGTSPDRAYWQWSYVLVSAVIGSFAFGKVALEWVRERGTEEETWPLFKTLSIVGTIHLALAVWGYVIPPPDSIAATPLGVLVRVTPALQTIIPAFIFVQSAYFALTICCLGKRRNSSSTTE